MLFEFPVYSKIFQNKYFGAWNYSYGDNFSLSGELIATIKLINNRLITKIGVKIMKIINVFINIRILKEWI